MKSTLDNMFFQIIETKLHLISKLKYKYSQ